MKHKRTGIFVFFCFLAVYIVGHIIYFGSLFRLHVYTETELLVPENISNRKVVLHDGYSYVIDYVNYDYPYLKKIHTVNREIMCNGPYYGGNLKTATLAKNTTFTIAKAFIIRKNGITTIDSGPGDFIYLILKDENNVLYKLPAIGLDSIGDYSGLKMSFKDEQLKKDKWHNGYWGSFTFVATKDNKLEYVTEK
jgi:hypothetical protein